MSLKTGTEAYPTESRAAEFQESDRDSGFLLDADSELDPWLSIVMPTLNEEGAIEECIRRAISAIEMLAVPAEIIVSDSSTDRTPQIAEDMGAIVIQAEELGYGAAYRNAFEFARGQYIVMGDADCSYNFEVIPELLEPVAQGSADIVLGSRLNGEIEQDAMPALHRYIGNPLLTAFLNAFYDAGVSDAHSGFRVFHRDVLEEISLNSNGMEFASEMIMEAAANGLNIEEVPIVYHRREGEATLNSFEDGWRHVKFMLLNAPGYLFSIPGTVFSITGLALMTLALSNITIAGLRFGYHTMVAGSLLTIVGYEIIMMGVFATIAGNPIKKPSDWVTESLINQVSLERGATVGLILLGSGGLYAALLVLQWFEAGSTGLPFFLGDIVAFTAIVLGVQTVFGSFFMSAMASLGDSTAR